MQQKSNDAEFDEYSGNYSDHVNSAIGIPGLKVDFFTQVKANYIADCLAKDFNRADVDVLDVGCGVGNYHPHLRSKVRRLAGVDVSAESIRVARTHNPDVEYDVFDGVSLPFASASFDLAFAICVFHHVDVKSRLSLTSDIHRVLKPQGMLLIFEHNPRNPLTMRVVNRCEFDKDAVLLLPGETEGLLSAADFEGVESRHILTVPSWNGATRSLDRVFSRLPVGAQYFTSGRKLVRASNAVVSDPHVIRTPEPGARDIR